MLVLATAESLHVTFYGPAPVLKMGRLSTHCYCTCKFPLQEKNNASNGSSDLELRLLGLCVTRISTLSLQRRDLQQITASAAQASSKPLEHCCWYREGLRITIGMPACATFGSIQKPPCPACLPVCVLGFVTIIRPGNVISIDSRLLFIPILHKINSCC